MRKQFYLLCAAVACAIILLGILIVQYEIVKRDLARVTKRELAYSKEQGAVTLVQKGSTFIYYPSSEKGKVHDGVKEELAKLAKNSKDGDYRFIGLQYSDSNFNGVKEAKVYQHTYYKSLSSLREGKRKVLATFYMTTDHQRLDLPDFLSRTTDLKADLATRISQDQTLSQNQQEKVLTSLKETKLANLAFNLESSQLSFKLARETINLPLTGLYNILNPNYLKGDDLETYKAYKRGDGRLEKMSGHVVALTFDDGPNPDTTPQVLKILKKYKAKATFFVVGKSVAGNEKILKDELDDGHDIGNHSWDHPQLSKLPTTQAASQINQTNQAIEQATGKAPILLRPPYGATNPTVRSLTDLYQVLWDVDTYDWKYRNTQSILNQVKAQTQDGSVILMHDIHQTTVDALPTVLDYLSSQGYKFVTVSQLYGYV